MVDTKCYLTTLESISYEQRQCFMVFEHQAYGVINGVLPSQAIISVTSYDVRIS